MHNLHRGRLVLRRSQVVSAKAKRGDLHARFIAKLPERNYSLLTILSHATPFHHWMHKLVPRYRERMVF
jgi:hypothetical protein